MAQGQRKHTDEERAAALAVLASTGGNITAAARQVGVSPSTLRNWRAGIGVAPPEVVAEKTATLADLFEREAHAALERAGMVRDDARYQQLMTGAAIATDKAQLLRGGATARVAHEVVIDVSDDGRGD